MGINVSLTNNHRAFCTLVFTEIRVAINISRKRILCALRLEKQILGTILATPSFRLIFQKQRARGGLAMLGAIGFGTDFYALSFDGFLTARNVFDPFCSAFRID
jgi:hypothetical protein